MSLRTTIQSFLGKSPYRLSETDVKVQRVPDLPPIAIRESFMGSFWAPCHPKSPINI
ncbi:predicted protein [Plenodomus lingam JN3]|uniref:Predicted protein n=1 Tax=Leptosphaeria maculans (strain JN3 / isolate v23.1.3 / race Av1-4-5-6-7-8) TaxID=985895 RepID=E5R558_LEPMJ|nr:predicted protein [Plenodomus lingam JN3]CBX92028.1 predicted protein [Plenodomus lingam JN3]